MQETGMLLILTVASYCCLSATYVAAYGAGRAFPIAAENFAIDNFQIVNPSIVRNSCLFTFSVNKKNTEMSEYALELSNNCMYGFYS